MLECRLLLLLGWRPRAHLPESFPALLLDLRESCVKHARSLSVATIDAVELLGRLTVRVPRRLVIRPWSLGLMIPGRETLGPVGAFVLGPL